MFGTNLKKYRKAKGLTQEQLASEINSLIGTQYKKSSVSSWENNVSPSIEVIEAIAEILDIPEQFLFNDSNDIINTIIKNEMPNLKMIMENTKQVNVVDGYVGAGSSSVIENVKIIDTVYVDKKFIKKGYHDKTINSLIVEGDSMIPYVNGGDRVLYHPLEKGTYNYIDGKYIISNINGVMVKNLSFRCNGDIVISSENKAYSDEIIKANETQEYLDIIGIVVGRILCD